VPDSIALTGETIATLDLSPLTDLLEPALAAGAIADYEQTLSFVIDIPRDPTDPRELSEIPEVRLWFVRADARYPWLPYVLDWREGELARYAAMLIPHEFHRTEGIRFNPEALEIFVMNKVFVLHRWLPQQNVTGPARIQSFAQVLGYELDDQFFALLSAQ